MKFSLDNLVTLDCEVYPNYFLVAFKNIKNNRNLTFEVTGKDATLSTRQTSRLKSVMSSRTTFGFNSRNYDIPIILGSMKNFTCEQIFKMSNYIISNNQYGWQTMKHFNLQKPKKWKHFDIQEPAPGVRVSLKLYGGRMHSQKLQDLPIDPGTILSKEQMGTIKQYCLNDLNTNIDLFEKIEQRMQLRVDMSQDYNQDLMSKSDAQIAEAVIKSELQTEGMYVSVPQVEAETTFLYSPPGYIQFKHPDCQHALELIKGHSFGLNQKGSVELPKEVKNLRIELGLSTYQLGIGGLHSKEKKQTLKPPPGWLLIDKDVTSYYPAIILTLGLYPRHLGHKFLSVYKSIVDTRLAAKNSGKKVINESLKIVINGSFGKLGNKYSILYSPDLMTQVTLTGQLSLLMLIERLELSGLRIMSANTDGFVAMIKEEHYEIYEQICFDWELDTQFELEETRYKALYSRDVNNYLAIKIDNETKGKGVFSQLPLQKNPQAAICVEAVEKLLTENSPIELTIKECTDIRKFITVRTVTGGAIWKNEYLGKVVRWVFAHNGDKITYKKNGNKVATSDGAFPIMDLGVRIGDIEIDFDKYIEIANDILGGLGNDT